MVRRPSASAPSFLSAAKVAAGQTPLALKPERAAETRRMFDRIARRYDRCNALLSFGMDQRLRRLAVHLADLPQHAAVLDLCTGTGDLAAAAQQLLPQAKVVGLDFSRSMLELARHKLDGPRVNLIQADCLALPVRDGTFDAVTIGWGLRNLADLNGGLAEAARVLKPGGKLAVLDFSRPKRRVVRAAFDLFFGAWARLVGLLAPRSNGAYQYLPRSIARFPAADELSEMIARTGLTVRSVHPRLFGCICIHVAIKETPSEGTIS